MKGLISRIKFFIIDHYHILFKSAAVNHLRIQEVLKNPDGTFQLTLKFNSYSELKEYQKKLRRLTVSLSGAVAMVIVAFVVAPFIMNPNRSSAANYIWTQGTWSTKDQTKVAVYPADNGDTITNYYESSGVAINGGDVTLTTPQTASAGDSSYSGATGFYRSDANGTYSASGTTLALKKVQGRSCVDTSECSSGECADSICVGPCSASTACGQSCSYNGSAYSTVLINGKCWFAENLRTTKFPNGTNISTGMYCDSVGCDKPWGRLYTFDTAINFAGGASATNANIQGICPSGWRIPNGYYVSSGNYEDFTTLGTNSDVLKLTGTSCSYWSAGCTGNNSLGFSAVGSGYYLSGTSSFISRGAQSYFWTSALYSGANAYYYMFAHNTSTITRNNFPKTYGLSVRCVKD